MDHAAYQPDGNETHETVKGITLTAMASQEQPIKAISWRPRWRLRTLLLFVSLVSVGFGVATAYFEDARLAGKVYFRACACGLVRATVADGKVILSEVNHDRPAGTVIATVETKDDRCTIRLIEEDGTSRPAGEFLVDHLGAKNYDEEQSPSLSRYYLLVDNWKLYPAFALAWIERTVLMAK